MYDDEEEIRRKRRNLILIIVVIVAIIILLLILLFVKTKNSGKKNDDNKMECTLKIVSGDQDSEGNYTGNVVVGFDKISPEKEITSKNVGIKESKRNGETYTVNKVGTVTVQGFIYNKKGEVKTCSTEVTVSAPKGGCKLSVTSGTEGDLGWYTSDVAVKLDSVETGNLTVSKYYITLKDEKTAPSENSDTYTVKNEGVTSLVGTIEYTNGNKSTCNLEVKKDTVKPECTLKVTSGESLGDGKYTGDVKVGFDKATDETSGVGSKGFGTAEDYGNSEYVFTAFETKEVTGFVRDKAGNLNSCKLTVTKAKEGSSGGSGSGGSGSGGSGSGGSGGSGSSGSGSGGSGSGGSGGYVPTGATVVNSSNRMCELMVNGAKIGGNFYSTVVVSFSKVNAGLTSSRITVNGQSDANQVTIAAPKSNATYTATASVTYNNGQTVSCSVNFGIYPSLDKVNYFKNNARFGQVVDYNPGVWATTAAMPTTSDGQIGGYYQGQSKNGSVACKDAGGPATKTGWYIYEVGNQVKIIHAGIPLCMYHSPDVRYTNALSVMNNHGNAAVFKDAGGLAADAYYTTLTDYTNLLSKGGAAVREVYYLAGANNNAGYSTDSFATYDKALWATSGDRVFATSGTMGLRPIVVLNAGVGASVGSDGAWHLELVSRAENNDDDSKLYERVNGTLTSTIADVESLYH